MSAARVIGVVLDALAEGTENAAQRWHNATEEGWIRLGPILIARQTWHDEQMRNAFDFGRDHGRTEVGGRAVPPVPVVRSLHAL